MKIYYKTLERKQYPDIIRSIVLLCGGFGIDALTQ